MAGLFGELRCFCLFVCFGVSLCFTNSLDLDFKPKTTKVVSLHIKSSILYRFSSTSVTSTIINDDVRATETFFEVTLPDAAFISNFTLEIDGNVYLGEIKEKEVAKNTYENARWMGQSAGHIETRPRDTNKFKISINIAAFSEVTFTLTYNELLQRRRGNYDHTIYVNPGQIVDSLLVEVTIQESRAITQLHVPPLRDDILTEHQNSLWNTYATIRRPSLTSAYIRYNPSPEDQKRASLQGMSGLFIVEYDVERTTNVGEVMVVNGYFVHYFAPQGLPRMKRKVLFILDYSGSMLGTKITQLKTAMSEILSNLAKGDRFNIIRFNGDVTKWWNHSALVEVNKYSVNAAKNFINDIEADGWTNINDALSEGMDLLQEDDEKDPTYASLMIFLTDGYATEGEMDNSKILDTISSRNKDKVPIFSLSFGDEADYGFLKKLSAQNNGFVRKIYEESDASLQLTGFYGEVASTLLSNLTFRYLDDTVVGKSVTNTIYPIFFEGSEIVISGKVSEVNVSAMSLEICTDGQTQILKSSTKKERKKSVYPKTNNQKGLALILNFTKGRPGANVDFWGINDFFEKTLNFECHVETDPSKEEVEGFLEETACLFNNKRTAAKYYCLLVFIMSHGNEDGIRTHDGKTISLDDIVSYFKNDKLKYFAGKPKCFFIQACRGSSPQGVVDLSDDKEEVMIDQVVGKISIPTDADLLLAYATTPGYFAYRRPNVGSWFFCNLLEIFKEHYEEEHVEDMLIDVKERLAYDEEWQTNEGFKQMPCTWSTLTKRFFLAPQQLAE